MNESKEPVAIIPLHFFDSDVELLRLNEGISLRTIDGKELQALKKRTRKGFGKTLELSLFDTKYVIENRTISARNLWAHVDDMVLALRLLKTGDVKVSTAFFAEGEETAIGHRPGLFHRTSYFLKNEEEESLRTLWKNVQELHTKPYLDYPIRNFMNAYDEVPLEDKVVDLIIALESLVFYQEESTIQSAGKVIGIAIGIMLGRDQEERSAIKNALIHAYRIRNARVHGNAEELKKWSKEEMERLSSEIEDYLRRALRKFVEE
jgi:hypothetical protein